MRAVPVLAMTVATGLASVANAQQQPTPAQPAAQAQCFSSRHNIIQLTDLRQTLLRQWE